MNGCRPLSEQEYSRIYTHLSVTRRHRDLLMVSLLMWTGYRINEILSLRMKDLVLPNGVVRDRIKVDPRFMKKRSPRPAVLVNGKLREDINRYVTYLESSGRFCFDAPAIPSRKGGPISYTQAYRVIMDVFDACDVYEDVACHSFRKTFCRDFYHGSGRDIIATMRVMGHSSPQTTLKYLSTGQAQIDDVIAGM